MRRCTRPAWSSRPGPITDYAPLYKGARDEITTQWNMKEVERVGLLKMDFLGLSTLTLIQDCLAEIKRTEGIDLDIDNLPLDDPKTYKVFGEGAAYGIFQFESSGMRDLLRKAKPEQSRRPDRAERALSSWTAQESGMVDDFIARKQGQTEIKYELPQLEPILSDTYGVIAYQEQVMRIAQSLAGFSWDRPTCCARPWGRRTPRSWRSSARRSWRAPSGMALNEKKATKIFELMEYFAGYGFNKSHSTAYAFLAYQTAYLKANYPWHFAAALLTIEAQNTDKLAMYLGECRDRGIPVLPPDINESQLNFSVEPGRGVRFGLTAIKGLGEGAVRAILDARTRLGGRIPSLHELCEILDLRLANKRVFEALVKSGACDSLGVPKVADRLRPVDRPVDVEARRQVRLDIGELARFRARLFAAIESACEHGTRTQRDKDLGQTDLFGGGDDDGALAAVPLPDVAAWTEIELLNHERDTLGCS